MMKRIPHSLPLLAPATMRGMSEPRTNEQITASPVRVVTKSGEILDPMPIIEAVALARKAGLDLVEVGPDAHPAIWRIMDYANFLQYKRTRQRP